MPIFDRSVWRNFSEPTARVTGKGKTQMQVKITTPSEDMEVKNNGSKLEANETRGNHLSNYNVTKIDLISCAGGSGERTRGE